MELNKELIKIKYEDLIKNDNEKNTIYNSFQTQKMVIIKGIPNLRQTRKQIFEVIKNFPREDNLISNNLFSVGLRVYNNMINFYSNKYTENYINEVKSNGYGMHDSPDLLANNQFDKFPKIKELTSVIIELESLIVQRVLKLLDMSLKEKCELTTDFEQMVKTSESTKMRSIFFLPHTQESLEKNQDKYFIYPHFDSGLISAHVKDQYFNFTNQKLTETTNPGDAGLVYRDSEGRNNVLYLEEDELMLQAGVSLQILTRGIVKAQGHSVNISKKPNISRISNVVFFQPKLLTPLTCPIKDTFNALEPSNYDKEFVNPNTYFSKHWENGILWIDAHHYQILRFMFYGFTKLLQPLPSFKIEKSTYKDYVVVVLRIKFDIIDSTQTLAEKVHNDYISINNFFALTAEEQTLGRGQEKNTWFSPKGNLYVTYIFILPSKFKFYTMFLATVSVLMAIKEFTSSKLNPKIKWINDIFINDKKVSGSLVKFEDMGSKDVKVLMGIGVNLNSKKEHFSKLPEASSLSIESGVEYNVDEFFECLTNNLVRNNQQLQKEGFEFLFKIMRDNLEYLGEEVNILDFSTLKLAHSGVFKVYNKDGSIDILEDGKILNLTDGKMKKKI